MLRDFVFDALRSDAQLNALGYNTDTIWPMMSVDSPPSRLFMVLRWGADSPTPGRDSKVIRTGLTVWAYNKDPDYGPIGSALRRARDILVPIAGVSHGDGWILDVENNGTSEDLYDDGYVAVTRNRAFTITASDS